MDKIKLVFSDDDSVKYYNILGKLVAEHKVTLDDLTSRTIERFVYWAANHESCFKRKDLEVLGLHLYNMLFPPDSEIRENLKTDYQYFDKQRTEGKKTGEERRLRFTLVFDKAARKWANYPWEFLYVPLGGDGFFLAGEETDLILTRYVPEAISETAWDPDEKPLRILIVLAQPEEMHPLDAEDVIGFIESLKSPGYIAVKTVRNPTYKDLDNIINDDKDAEYFPPHILHFIGHGEPGRLFLVKSKEDAYHEMLDKSSDKMEFKDPTDAATFANLFDKNSPTLVFLHACSGAEPDSINGFSDIARKLVYSKIPAVVAMQYEITNEAASTFAQEFYRRLGEGCEIDEAVKDGRRALGRPEVGGHGVWNDRSFGTPVVYLQRELPIVKKGKPTPKPIESVERKKVPCPNPKCDGSVITGDRFCLACMHKIQECGNPVCDAMVDLEIGICAKCGWTPEAVGGSEAPTPLPVKPQDGVV